MSIKQRKSPKGTVTWEARHYLEGRGSKRISRSFRKKVDAEKFLAELKLYGSSKTLGQSVTQFKKPTLSAEADFWIQQRLVQRTPAYQKRAQGIVGELKAMYGDYGVDSINVAIVDEIVASRLKRGQRPATVNRVIEVLKAILKYSADCGRTSQNTLARVQKLHPQSPEMKFWTREESETFLTYTNLRYPPGSSNRWVHLVYALALNTGMRAGEIWGLQGSDLGHDGRIRVVRQYDRVAKATRETKGKAKRVVYCDASLCREIWAMVKENGIPAGGYLFRTNDGGPICHEVFVRKYFLTDVQAVGVKRIRFHDLRHTACSTKVAEGVDINTVRVMAGHKDIRTTLAYVHTTEQQLKDAAARTALAPSQLRPKLIRMAGSQTW